MTGGGGGSGGAGGNGVWETLPPSVSPLPPNQYSGGEPARVTTPCFEIVVQVTRYVSIWMPYATDWPPSGYDFRAGAAQAIFNPEIWEDIDVIYNSNPLSNSSRFVSSSIPEEVSIWRDNHPHWITDYSCVYSAGVEFAEIEGNLRCKWTVIVYDFQCFAFLYPPPILPIIPMLPLLTSLGHGFGGVGVFGSINHNGVGLLWQKKRRCLRF